MISDISTKANSDPHTPSRLAALGAIDEYEQIQFEKDMCNYLINKNMDRANE